MEGGPDGGGCGGDWWRRWRLWRLVEVVEVVWWGSSNTPFKNLHEMLPIDAKGPQLFCAPL